MFDLKGKTAFVTGSSRGIGRAILLAYAKQGADVILHCRKQDARAEETLALARETGVRVFAVYGDLSQKDTPAKLVEEIKTMGLKVDILVLNASVELRRHWTEISDEEYDLQLNTNLRSPMKLMQYFIPEMQRRGWGRVITMGSVQQAKPHPDMLVYAAGKAALCNMAQSLAAQVAGDGVTINNLFPGAIHTHRNDQDYREHVRSLIPVKYIGKPEDIAAMAVYLASEESKYMTGENIYVAGGKDL